LIEKDLRDIDMEIDIKRLEEIERWKEKLQIEMKKI
jgi:hypothetical protein